MIKVLSINFKCFIDPLLFNETIFCHFDIFKEVIFVLFGNEYWKWNQCDSLCENENVFARHHCKFQNRIKSSSWMTKSYNLYIILLLSSLLYFFRFMCITSSCRQANIFLMITLAKLDYPIISQCYFPYLYVLS